MVSRAMRRSGGDGVRGARRWVLGGLSLGLGLSTMACLLGDGGGASGGDDGEPHACFVHCNTGFGVSSACFSSLSDYRTQRSCEDKAQAYCGEGKDDQVEMVELCECSSSCEPDWYARP